MDHVVTRGDKKMLHAANMGLVAIVVLLAGHSLALAQDALKLAVGAKGIWDQSSGFPESSPPCVNWLTAPSMAIWYAYQ
jgi:hypothetical protein